MIPYMGGKSVLARWIIDNFPKNYQNSLYVEVFGGGGWVLFKKEPSLNEVYNDLFQDVVTLFRVIRDRYPAMRHKVKWTLHSRAMFDEAKEKLSKTSLKDIDRALFYLIVKGQSFSSNGSIYAYRLDLKKRNEWAFFLDRIEKIRDRMKTVNIECLDFERLIEKYDSKDTVFYLDPPYVDKEFYYHVPFERKDHERLAGILKQIKGRFALSYYPHELLDRLYKGFNVLTKESTKFSCGITRRNGIKKRPKSTELLIMNY